MKLLCLENLIYDCSIKVGSHHYAKLFSRDHEVLWLSLPFHLLNFISGIKNERFLSWNYNKMKRVSDTLFSFTPFTFIPYGNYFLIRSDYIINNYYKFMPGIVNFLRKTGFIKPDIVWITDPRQYSLLKILEGNPQIYHRCVDSLASFKEIPDNITFFENEIMKRSRKIFFTSTQLLKQFPDYQEKSIYLPNGCEFEHFNDPCLSEDEFEGTKYFNKDKINILYFGSVCYWFDFKAIEVLSNNNNYNLVIVGPISGSIPHNLTNRDNVFFTGPKPYKQMPLYAKYADIGIIPFLINDLTNPVNPIKLYEYCAAGLPSVSSGFDTVKLIDGPFEIYNDHDELIQKTKYLITLINDQTHKKRLVEFARDNSWASRYKIILNNFA